MAVGGRAGGRRAGGRAHSANHSSLSSPSRAGARHAREGEEAGAGAGGGDKGRSRPRIVPRRPYHRPWLGPPPQPVTGCTVAAAGGGPNGHARASGPWHHQMAPRVRRSERKIRCPSLASTPATGADGELRPRRWVQRARARWGSPGVRAASAAGREGGGGGAPRPAEPLPLLQGLEIRRLRVKKGAVQTAVDAVARARLYPGLTELQWRDGDRPATFFRRGGARGHL